MQGGGRHTQRNRRPSAAPFATGGLRPLTLRNSGLRPLDPSRQRPSAADPSRQRPPAYIGAQEDHESAVQVLFDGGADVNKAANGGGTPACIGVYVGRIWGCAGAARH